jgi:hypothetical protein
MKRRQFIALVGGAAAWPLAAQAQQLERMRRIGVLVALAEDDSESVARRAAFEQALFDKQLARPINKHNREKEYAALDSWAPISRHHRTMEREGRPRAQIALGVVPSCSASQGRFCAPYGACSA